MASESVPAEPRSLLRHPLVLSFYLPSLLLPSERSVARLREAAARFQSDLLFVYATDCQVFSRYRVFAADERRVLQGLAVLGFSAVISDIAEPHGLRARTDLRLLVTIAPPI